MRLHVIWSHLELKIFPKVEICPPGLRNAVHILQFVSSVGLGEQQQSVTRPQEVSQCCGLSYWFCVYVCWSVCWCVCKSGPPADKNRENFSGFHRIPTFKHLIIKSKHSSLLFFSQKTHFLFYEATHSELEKQKPTAAIILCVYRSTEPHPGTSSASITSLLLRRLFIVIFNFYNECSEESRNIKLNVIFFSPMTLRSASSWQTSLLKL